MPIPNHALLLSTPAAAIENRSDYVRDGCFAEDASRIRCNPGIFARLRSFAANILRFNGVHNVSDGRHRIAFGGISAILAMRVMYWALNSLVEAPDPEADPVDVVRSNAAKYIATLDLGAGAISTGIWANGYGYDFSWVHLPVLDDWGFPIQEQGVTEFPGLYFLGMNFLHYRKSGILLGVGDDAAHVAAHIAARASRWPTAPSAAS